MGNIIEGFAFDPPSTPTQIDTTRYNYYQIPIKTHLTIPLIYLPYPKAKFTIIYSHGNNSDLGQIIPFLEDLRVNIRVSVVGYEYLGYHSGKPTEKGCLQSLEATYQFVKDKLRIPESRIILMGHSMGTNPTLNFLASPTPSPTPTPLAVIISAPFRSLSHVYCGNSDESLCNQILSPINFMKNESLIVQIKEPILLLHGKADQRVSIENSKHLERLIKSVSPLRCQTVWLDNFGHDSSPNQEYWHNLKKFLVSLQ